MDTGNRYQFQPLGVIGLNVLHNVSMHHQFCHCGKFADVDILKDAEELQDI